MELSHSLLLNEVALKQTPDPNKPVFFYEWLKYLERILPVTQKADIRSSQKQLIEQLTQRISTTTGPTTRALLSKCISQVFLIADSYDLFQTVNLCNDLLKSKDDSNAQIQVKLTALAVLGQMYEQLKKVPYDESFEIITKWIKSAESTSRAEILLTISKMARGLGTTAYPRHREIFKIISKSSLTDRVMFVRVAAIKCLHNLCSELGSPIYPIDVDAIMTMALKSMDKSTHEVRVEIAKVFGKIASYAVNNKEQKPVATNQQQNQPTKNVTLDVVLKFMSETFLRGGLSGFLKGGTSASGHKEVRIGIALAYVEVARELGSKWLERNLSFWQKHLFELAYSIGPMFAAETLHLGIDARHCISYIYRHTIGQMLSENAQINACKNFGILINESLEKMVVSNEDTNDRIMIDDGISASCTVALLEIAALVRQVDSSIAPLFVEANGIQETVFECVTHPAQMVRVSAAWCLRCVIRSVPTQATPLINLCFTRLKNDRRTSLAISGYSTALAALTAGSQQTELGIPFQKTHDVFDIGREMVMTTQDRMKLALSKTNGWMLITSVLSMGGSYVRRNLRHLLPLWRCSFPRSVEEAKSEIQRGDAFTWECALRSRAGAFASMEAFVVHAGELLNEELLKQIVQLVEITLHTLSVLASNNLLKTQPMLRPPVHLLRIRLYALLNRIPFKYYETLFRTLLSELVADITLSDNPQLTTTCSKLAGMCTAVGECLLGGWSTTQNELEVQLHSSQCESTGALEYDPNCLIIGATTWAQAQQMDADDANWPQPLPSQVASLDSAIQTFGRIYPLLVTKHKTQLTDHFAKCLNDPKQQNTARFHAVEMNILGAMLCAMRSMGDYRNARIEDEDLRRKTVQLLREYICSDRPLLKCLAVEALGRLAQSIAEPQFVATRTVEIFEDLRIKNEEKSKTGLTLALGTLYRYKGSLGSDQHFKKAVGDLLTFAQINSSPTVQAWAILSLSLIASTGGGMFRDYVKPSLEFCLRQLLNTPSNNVEVVQCIGKLVSALITSVGPELAAVPTTPSGSNIEEIRQSCLSAASMMFAHGDPQVKAEAIACQQQLHLFAPRYVELDRLVASLCDLLYSPHQILRRATIQCLKQLLQREAREVREHAQNLLPAGIIDQTKWKQSPLPETGLEGALFELLDLESDVDQRQNIKDCLLFLVQATSDEHLNFWLSICKDILASSTTTNPESILRSTMVIQDQKSNASNELAQSGQQDTVNADDEEDDNVLSVNLTEVKNKVAPRWPTRVFAFTIVRKLMSLCDTERAHLDPALAKEIQMSSNGRADYLVFHLADLVRMSFMGATSENSSLRLAGLACLQDIIDRFAEVPEPEIQEPHVILEQFQAQVSAALGPAFDVETPSHVTAAACQVCSAWICSGVARNLNDLRRVNQLLVSSLEKLKDNSMNAQLYNESAATLEKLSILKAWAEVYVVALKRQEPIQHGSAWPGSAPQTPAVQHIEFEYSTNSAALLDLVNPELSSLVGHWLAALRDAAMLSLSSEFELPQNGGAFYTLESADSCREYYNASVSSLLLAASMWLRQNNFATALFNQSFGGRKQSTEELQADATAIASKWTDQERRQHFNLILAMSVESLCTANRSASGDDRLIHTSLDTLSNLIDCPWSQLQLMSDVRLPIEIMNVLHRLILTNDNLQVQRHCADVVQSLLNAACEALKVVANEKDFDNGNLPDSLRKSAPTSFDGFDPESSRIHAQSSLVFATLEVCLCLLVRQIPQVNPGKTNPIAPLHFRKYGRLSAESNELIKRAIALLTRLSSLCTPKGSIVVLPSMMFLVLGVFRESSRVEPDAQKDSARGHITEAAQAAIKAIRTIVFRPPVDESFEQWASIMRSSLLSLLKMTEEDEERGRVDEAVVMVATCVMLTNMPPRLYIGAVLFQKVCALIRSCLESTNFDVQYKALQTVNSLFSRREMAAAYVKELGPTVFAKLKPYVVSTEESGDKQVVETDLPVLSNLSDSELLTIQETIKAVEAVLAMAKGEKEFAFVNLLTRCLARFLCPDPQKQLNVVEDNVRKLHEFAFQRLNLIGPAHPELFSRLIKNSRPLRLRIESAAQVIAKQQQLEKHTQLLQQQKALAAKQQALKAAQQQPVIELKTFAELPAVEKDF